jgi:hypothetical protein
MGHQTQAKQLLEQEHKLIIRSQHDVIAECKSGKWYHCFTGQKTERELNNEWMEHVAHYSHREER